MPTRKAPTAAEALTWAATPATRIVRPSTDRSSTSAFFDHTSLDTSVP